MSWKTYINLVIFLWKIVANLQIIVKTMRISKRIFNLTYKFAKNPKI